MSSNQYDDVILRDQQGSLWEGTVITPLTLLEWADRLHYKVLRSSGFLPSKGGITNLRPAQRKVSGMHVVADNIKKLLSKLT